MGDYLGTENVKLLKIRIFINIICVCEKKHVSLQHTNNKINIIDYNKKVMATAIKAIPTLYGEDAIRFREEMEANERAFLAREKKDREKDPFIIEMRKMLKRSGMR